MATSPLIEGFLYKNKKYKTTGWNKRWFALRDCGPDGYVLESARDKKKAATNRIDLNQCETIIPHPPVAVKDSFRHVFSVKTTKQQYFLVASSEAEMHNWISCLSRVCSFTKENDNDDEDDDAVRPLPNLSDHRGSISTLDSLPSGRSTFSMHGQNMGNNGHESPSHTGTLQNDHRSSPRPSALVLTSTLNFPSSAQKKNIKGDNPYIFLAECISKAVPSRPSSQMSQFSDSITLTRMSLEHEPSIPEEPAPPPPDNIYKHPPNCIVYDSNDPATGQRIERKRWSDEKPGDFPATSGSTYDTPARSTTVIRIGDPPHDDTPLLTSGAESKSPTSAGETYDRVPPLTRNAGRQPARVNITSTTSRLNVRKQSLPTVSDVENQDGLYDQVPKPRTANSSPCVTRVDGRVSAAVEPEASLYDRVPARKQDGRDSVSSSLSSARPSLSGINLLSPRETSSLAAPPSVDRNSKPSPVSGHDTLSMDRSPRSRLGSPHSSVGSMGSTTPATPILSPPATAFAYPRQNSLTTTVTVTKVRRSTSQEDLAANTDAFARSDFRARGTAGTRTLPRQPKHKMQSNDIQYTDVQVCLSSGQSENSQTLPQRVAAIQRHTEPLRILPSLRSQISQSGSHSPTISSSSSTNTDYKKIDQFKTKALARTKKDVEKGEEEKDKRKN